jgi:hypothetical protein
MNRWRDIMQDEITLREFYEKLDSIHKDITDIKIQTTKTNGRVSVCEKQIVDMILHNKNQDRKITEMAIKVGIVITTIILVFYYLTGTILPI